MTNSLLKDSHITQFCRPNTPYQFNSSGQGNSKSRGNSATENNNIGIRVYNNKPADKTSFCGFFNSKMYTNDKVKKFISLAGDKPAVFNAVFAIALTCVLRPLAIMGLPGDSKHKDDKKYAAAHSIASGAIGYLISTAIFDPLGEGMRKVANNLDKYIEKYPKLAYLKNPVDTSKGSLPLIERAKKYMSQVPEAIVSPPKAIVTIALIPPILKYVFGWEKKKPAQNNQNKNVANIITENPALVNFKNSSVQNSKVLTSESSANSKPSFTGAAAVVDEGANLAGKSKFFEPVSKPYKKFKNGLELKIADGFAKILGNGKVKNVIEKSETPLLSDHLQAAVGVILSGFYMQQTLNNKSLDEQKRNTLAINQGIVCAISTAGGYLVNRLLRSKIGNIEKNFIKANPQLSTNSIAKYRVGIQTAASLMIFGTIYRFLSPVFVTPIANKLGNHLNEKKQAKLAQEKAAGNQ